MNDRVEEFRDWYILFVSGAVEFKPGTKEIMIGESETLEFVGDRFDKVVKRYYYTRSRYRELNMKYRYVNGLIDGKALWYYNDGSIECERYCRDGEVVNVVRYGRGKKYEDKD